MDMEGTDTAGNTIMHSFNTESVKQNKKKNADIVNTSMEESLSKSVPKVVNSMPSRQQSKSLL